MRLMRRVSVSLATSGLGRTRPSSTKTTAVPTRFATVSDTTSWSCVRREIAAPGSSGSGKSHPITGSWLAALMRRAYGYRGSFGPLGGDGGGDQLPLLEVSEDLLRRLLGRLALGVDHELRVLRRLVGVGD